MWQNNTHKIISLSPLAQQGKFPGCSTALSCQFYTKKIFLKKPFSFLVKFSIYMIDMQHVLTHLLIARHTCQWIGGALVQIMACRLFDAKPLSKPMLYHCQFGPLGKKNFTEILIKIWSFSFKKMRLKMPCAKITAILFRGDELTYNGLTWSLETVSKSVWTSIKFDNSVTGPNPTPWPHPAPKTLSSPPLWWDSLFNYLTPNCKCDSWWPGSKSRQSFISGQQSLRPSRWSVIMVLMWGSNDRCTGTDI